MTTLVPQLEASLRQVEKLVQRLREECARGIHDFPEDPITGRLGPCTVCLNPHYVAASAAPTAD